MVVEQKWTDANAAKHARNNLVSAGSFHWTHWVIICFSLLLTCFAWHYSSSQFESRIKIQFEREADHVSELIQERLRKYEDALWSGVAFVRSSEGEVDFDRWKRYAESIHLEEKYPGINGIGVIDAITNEGVPEYLKLQQLRRPDFKIYPDHEGDERLPISYVIPVKGNEKAIGLDIAHETNRYLAAKKARDSGTSQITGPIKLVQDSAKTPGFLFYAPFYRNDELESVDDRRDHFAGMVYAPFVVNKLMAGTLRKDKRQVGIRLTDEAEVLYDEHVDTELDFDPDPLFKRSEDVSLYGRTWTFDIWSAASFREASNDSQPLTILIGGIIIDALLLMMFISMSRTSQRALQYADSMTKELKANEKEIKKNEKYLAQRAQQLETSNADLEQFAYVASHDLQEPLRKISSFCSVLEEDYSEHLDEDGKRYIAYVVDGAARMKTLIQDLLGFSRVQAKEMTTSQFNVGDSFGAALARLDLAIEDSGAQVTAGDLPAINADPLHLTQLLQNLIGNAIKYRGESAPVVHFGVEHRDQEQIFFVRDNGIGIEPQYHDRVFGIFKRLHGRDEYSGNGIGLAICKRIVERYDGAMWIESEIDNGCTVFFTLPKSMSGK